MTPDPPRLRDPDLPAVEILLGPDAIGPLGVVFEATGARLGGIHARQVTWWPGRSITVRYDAVSESGERLPQVVACSGSIPDGAAIIESDGIRIGAWMLPHDPGLPGLASILDARTLGPMLEAIGVRSERISTRLRAYRPGRRAVVQVDTAHTRVFVKLGRPSSIQALHETHQRMSGLLPVPTSLGYDPELGILVMPSGRGRTLREVLDGDGSVPDPAALDELLLTLPEPVGRPRSRSPIAKLSSLTNLLAHVVPDQAGRLDELTGRIGPEIPGPTVPVHGDFHDGQLLIEDGAITGLLDVDTHGVGHPADDPATMLGHLESRSGHAPRPERIRSLVADLQDMWTSRVDGAELNRRQSAVMLGLATGPFRVQQDDWPARVRERIHRAEQVLQA